MSVEAVISTQVIDTTSVGRSLMTAADAAAARTAADAQVTLVSGTNIKTVNSTSLLGSGDITVGLSGTGAVDNAALRADGTGGATLQTSAFVIEDNATASPNNTVNHASIQATGGTTNVSVSIVPKGTGAFCLQVPDGTATGGNVRGDYAVDLQLGRASANEVASGYGAFAAGLQCRASGSRAVAVGLQTVASGDFSFAANYLSTASGTGSTAFGGSSCAGTQSITVGDITSAAGSQSIGVGYQCFATGNQSQAFGYICSTGGGAYAMAHGINAGAYQHAMYAHSAGQFAGNGDAQSVRYVCRNKTTNSTPTTLFLDGSSTRLTVASGRIFSFTARITGIKSDGTAAAHYVRKGTIKRVSNTTSLVGSIETIGTDVEDNASTDVSITADDTNEALQISVTGIAAETWRWVAVVEGLEIAYGT